MSTSRSWDVKPAVSARFRPGLYGCSPVVSTSCCVSRKNILIDLRQIWNHLGLIVLWAMGIMYSSSVNHNVLIRHCAWSSTDFWTTRSLPRRDSSMLKISGPSDQSVNVTASCWKFVDGQIDLSMWLLRGENFWTIKSIRQRVRFLLKISGPPDQSFNVTA